MKTNMRVAFSLYVSDWFGSAAVNDWARDYGFTVNQAAAEFVAIHGETVFGPENRFDDAVHAFLFNAYGVSA